MNELNITEYSRLQEGVGIEPAIRVQKVGYSAEAGISNSLNEITGVVRLISDTDCRILFTKNEKEVKDDSTILPAGIPEYFSVSSPPLKISVIQL